MSSHSSVAQHLSLCICYGLNVHVSTYSQCDSIDGPQINDSSPQDVLLYDGAKV